MFSLGIFEDAIYIHISMIFYFILIKQITLDQTTKTNKIKKQTNKKTMKQPWLNKPKCNYPLICFSNKCNFNCLILLDCKIIHCRQFIHSVLIYIYYWMKLLNLIKQKTFIRISRLFNLVSFPFISQQARDVQ